MTDLDHRNDTLRAYFALPAGARPLVTPWDVGADAYLHAGSHPDIVERLWDVLGAALPRDGRCRAGGSPGLAHPGSGLVFGLAMGTQYALRLPPDLRQAAVEAGARSTTVWGVDDHFDLAATLGPEWVFGAWLQQELEWCRVVFDAEDAG